jgi:hypothetical protein
MTLHQSLTEYLRRSLIPERVHTTVINKRMWAYVNDAHFCSRPSPISLPKHMIRFYKSKCDVTNDDLLFIVECRCFNLVRYYFGEERRRDYSEDPVFWLIKVYKEQYQDLNVPVHVLYKHFRRMIVGMLYMLLLQFIIHALVI